MISADKAPSTPSALPFSTATASDNSTSVA